MNTFAVATVLNIGGEKESADMWGFVERAFFQAELSPPTFLHFSWHVAETYVPDRIQGFLSEIASGLSEMEAVTAGFGVFSSQKPVLYLPVCKTRSIADLHENLWNRLEPIAQSLNLLYSPDHWIPHVTLAYEEANAEKINRVCTLLISEKIQLHFQVDHFALIFRNGLENGLVAKIPFGRSL